MPVCRALRLAAAVRRDGLLYPALRARATTGRTVEGALADLGFDPGRIEALAAGYEAAADALFPLLLERARARDYALSADKLANRALPAHASKRLLYLAVRLLEPDVVVETGTFNGTYSTFILAALRDNGKGRLVSHDVPAYQPIEHAIEVPLPAGAEPGWIIPEDLLDRFELVLGDTRETLAGTFARTGPVDLFLHDSLHTTAHMLFEYRAAWEVLRPGGLLVSDDAFMTPAFWWFARRMGLPLRHIGAMGAIRVPAR